MKPFEDFFSEKAIINYLCKQRAKIAKKRNEHHIFARISRNEKYNYHRRLKKENPNDICPIMPPRRLWVNPSKKKRYKNSEKLNTIDKNKIAIYLTIQKHMNSEIKYQYLAKLKNFLKKIEFDINDKSFYFNKPRIRPEPKSIKGNECRPIASFLPRDNLINCLTNKYLALYFDGLFYDDSYAFRTVRVFGGEKRAPRHHDAFQKIINYLAMNNNKTIYVAECDMKKFYDTVNHKIVLNQFRKLCFRNIIKFKGGCDKRARKIFKKYLECYNFYRDVFQKNSCPDFFKKYNINDGRFEWVKDDIDKLYKTNDYDDIGIPQGGALSGLIANIVLDYADKKVMRTKDKDILYVRYCDDMIMMHTDEIKCKKALTRYKDALDRLKLFPHEIKNTEKYSEEFWSSKSKGPYIWDENNVPWVGFVGYEINRKGEIRIRKKSLKKERNKQRELVKTVIDAVSNGDLKVSGRKVIESTEERLIGMAIGRVNIWNYKNYKNDLCWANGFNLLNNNKYSQMQVKSLDRSRNKYLCRLRKFFDFLDNAEQDIKQRNVKKPNKQIIFLGKPFSYFYHAIEKK